MVEIQAKNISKNYGRKRVLKDIHFHFQNSIVGIAGSNGSGKSTLLKIMSGLLKPTSGIVTWSIDESELSPKEIHSRLGFAAPYIQLYEELTVEENVRFLIDLQEKLIETSIQTLMDDYQLNGLSNSLFGNLSTGQQQRVKLASAMIKNPDILMLDEPGSNLDEKGKSLVKSLIQSMRQQNRMVIIASNQSDELDLCEQTVNLNN